MSGTTDTPASPAATNPAVKTAGAAAVATAIVGLIRESLAMAHISVPADMCLSLVTILTPLVHLVAQAMSGGKSAAPAATLTLKHDWRLNKMPEAVPTGVPPMGGGQVTSRPAEMPAPVPATP